jgi:transposase
VSDYAAPDGTVRPSRGELARRRRDLLREPARLVTRREAAQIVGVSLDTVDRRVRRLTGEGRTPSGEIGLPAMALAEQLHDPWPGRGRPRRLDSAVVSRIVSQRNDGWTFATIAAALNDDGVATAHGGARWWPATVRKVLVASGGRRER